MSSQPFDSAQREAIWLAHGKKCAYTREPIEISSFHIDHVLPERSTGKHTELIRLKREPELPEEFDLFGYENLLPCKPSANLQKGDTVLGSSQIRFFLGIAAAKKAQVCANLESIRKRNIRGKALVLLQQALERKVVTGSGVAEILEKYAEQPEEIFELISTLKFAAASETQVVRKSEIDDLRNRPVRMGDNEGIDGVTLTNQSGEQLLVRTCKEYDDAIEGGFYAVSTFDMKMGTYFAHQSGLLAALRIATTPDLSYLNSPRVGIIDLELMPFSLFPEFGDAANSDSSCDSPLMPSICRYTSIAMLMPLSRG